MEGFNAIDRGDLAGGVEHLAVHEQRNILQPSMYNDWKLVLALRVNHLSFVTNFPSGLAQAIELTLASHCQAVEDGRTVGFSDNPLADLSAFKQRMPFVLKAAARFDQMLNGSDRSNLEQSIRDIAAGGGVQ